MRRRSTAAMAAVLLSCSALVPAHAAEGPRPPVVAVIGDYGAGNDAEASVARLVEAASPVAIVTTGDNVYDSDDYKALVGRFYGPWVTSKQFFPALGNHDYSEGVDAYEDYFDYLRGLRAYTRVVGDVQYFILDSDAALTSSREWTAQRTWLDGALRRSKTPWQVVVLHHPPYSSGTVHGSSTDMRWPFRAWGADLVLSGHEHHYERIVRQGLTYVVNGAGGRELYPFGTPVAGSRVRFDRDVGALFLSATPKRLSGEFRTRVGDRVDTFTLLR